MRNNGRQIFSKYEKALWCTQAVCSCCDSVVACNSALSSKACQKSSVDLHHFCPICGNIMRDDEMVDSMVSLISSRV